MSVQESSSAGSGTRSIRFLARQATRLSLPLLTLGGILHATPIRGHGEWQLQDSTRLASSSVALTTTKAAYELTAVDARITPHLNSGISLNQSGPTCALASSCSEPEDVPEPESLSLFGTGLLSLAGVIRRRLLR